MKHLSPLLFLLAGTLLCIGNTLQAKDYTVLETPEKYVRPKQNIDYSPTSVVSKGKAWVVYSDRAGNETYESPSNGSAQKATLNFMEELFPVEEKGEYLHVVKGNLKGGTLKINVTTDYGWISKTQLLLWSNCMVTQNEVTRKAILINTPEGVVEKALIINGTEEIRFYADPLLNNYTDKYSRLFHLFFIYKQEENSVLLGINDRHDPSYAKENIMGWVPINKVNVWDNRVAIEPNWVEEAANERQNKGIKAAIFNSRNSAEAYQEGMNVSDSHVFWDSDSYADRKLGDWRRFPLLNDEDNIMEVGVIGHVINNNKLIAPKDLAEMQQEYNKKRNKLRNINVVFVIDGSGSLQDYYKPLADAVRSFTSKTQGSKNNYRFGAVIFRDKKAGSNQTVEIQPLNADASAAAAFLDKQTPDFTDGEVENALNYGIKNAIKNTGMPADETNIIIVVGMAGSHERQDATFVAKDEIIQLLYDNNCHLIAFQARSGPEYDSFVYGMEEIIKQSAMRTYNYLREQHANRLKSQLKKPKLETDGSNKYILRNAARMGGIVFTGGKMTPEYLESEVFKALDSIGKRTDKLLTSLDYLVMGYGSKAVKPATEYMDDLNQSIFDFLGGKAAGDKSDLSMFLENSRQSYIKGYYTVWKRNDLQHPLFNKVLFLTRVELGQMLTNMEALSNAGNSSDRRLQMQKTWIELLTKYTGGDRSKYYNMTMGEITQQVFGLPGDENSVLRGNKLRNITDKAVISDVAFKEYAEAIQSKYNKLFKAYNQDNWLYSFRSNDVTYYWISEDMLP